MAVPFSRPRQSADRRRSSAVRNQNQRSQQQQLRQPRHPIAQFLEGQGGISLDQLSLTSRIAFYALYEAWRLLQDLSNRQNNNSGVTYEQQEQHTVYHHHQQEQQPQQLFENSAELPLPDVVRDSTQSTDASNHNSFNYGQNINPTKDHQVCDLNLPVQAPDVTNFAEIDRDYAMQFPDEDELDFSYPDIIPLPPTGFRDLGSAEDKELKRQMRSRRSVSTSSDYFSFNGSICGEPLEDSLSDSEDTVDFCKTPANININESNNNELVYDGINWGKVGHQLCEIASAFEVNYSPLQNEHQRELYRVYTQMKSRSLANSRTDESMSGLAKTVCRQVLLSTIWILLKKIL